MSFFRVTTKTWLLSNIPKAVQWPFKGSGTVLLSLSCPL